MIEQPVRQIRIAVYPDGMIKARHLQSGPGNILLVGQGRRPHEAHIRGIREQASRQRVVGLVNVAKKPDPDRTPVAVQAPLSAAGLKH